MATLPLFAQDQISLSAPNVNIYTDGLPLTVNSRPIAAGTGCVMFFEDQLAANTAVGVGEAFAFSLSSTSSIPDAVELIPIAPRGHVIHFKQGGTYMIDYEACFTTAGDIGIYVGPTIGGMFPAPNVSSGTTVAGTWLHGSLCGTNPQDSWYVYVTPMTVPLTVELVVGFYPIRVRVVKMN